MDTVKLERINIECPACRQRIEAVARDGRVKGYCAVVQLYVDMPIETQHAVETEHITSAKPTPTGGGRDSKGRFVKGNVPLNKTVTENKISANPAPTREGRDSRGRFVKGNVPLSKKG